MTIDWPTEYRALQQRLQGDWHTWYTRYCEYVERVQSATHDVWRTADFQRFLWEHDGVTTLGPGNAVTVPGAYTDDAVIDALWTVRGKDYPREPLERARAIEADFDAIMGQVHAVHSKRRPTARLLRVFAGLRPRDTVCLVSWSSLERVRAALGFDADGCGAMGINVLLRAEIAQLTSGESADDAWGLSRAIFAWHLHERLADAPDPAPTRVHVPPRDERRPNITSIRTPRDTLRFFLEAAADGVTIGELYDIAAERGYSRDQARKMRRALYTLGLYAKGSTGELILTDVGRRGTNDSELEAAVVPRLLETYCGFAEVLDLLRTHSEGLSGPQLSQRLRAWHPRWNSSWTPKAVQQWCRELGLVTDPAGDGIYRLTAAGEQWAATIEHDEPEPIDDPPSSATPVAFEALRTHMPDELIYRDGLLAEVHAALHTGEHKRFVLLSGLSGTGKTALARAYAEAYCEACDVDPDEHIVTQAVRPDWTDPTGLLGYFNPLTADARYETTEVLELLLRASETPEAPFFLILDEMNLARVEHYFAPFLSAMETGNAIYLHGAEEGVDDVPARIAWPKNLFIFGTVNMDETTHAFSDKVLDRAFTFELWDIELDRWRERSDFGHTDHDEGFALLGELYEILHPVRRHFGYRTCNEFMRYVAQLSPTIGVTKAHDSAVLTKVLPKLRGDDAGQLPGALEALRQLCVARELKRSAAKLVLLEQSLRTLGIVKFFA